MHKILLFIIIFLSITLSAKSNAPYECKVDPLIMYSIAQIEGHPQRPVGYPYIISFNNKKDVKRFKKENSNLKKLFISNRTVDCQDDTTCKEIYKTCLDMKIVNLDCGGMQINHKVWKKNSNIYFDMKQSYNFACKIISKNNQRKWTWENVARYHSGTKKLNKAYKKRLLNAIRDNAVLFLSSTE